MNMRQIWNRFWHQRTLLDVFLVSVVAWLVSSIALSAMVARILVNKTWFEAIPDALLATAPACAVLILLGAARVRKKRSSALSADLPWHKK
jgi:hypothetical protein